MSNLNLEFRNPGARGYLSVAGQPLTDTHLDVPTMDKLGVGEPRYLSILSREYGVRPGLHLGNDGLSQPPGVSKRLQLGVVDRRPGDECHHLQGVGRQSVIEGRVELRLG